MNASVNMRRTAVSTTASIPVASARSAIPRSGALASSGKAAAVSTRASRRMRAPWRAASAVATKPPKDMPTTSAPEARGSAVNSSATRSA